jgi:hypothetical protein
MEKRRTKQAGRLKYELVEQENIAKKSCNDMEKVVLLTVVSEARRQKTEFV